MKNKELSKETKERLKKNIDQEIERYEAMYELLSEEEKEAISKERASQIKKINKHKILKGIKRIFSRQ